MPSWDGSLTVLGKKHTSIESTTTDDVALWQASTVAMPESQQAALQALLDSQSASELPPADVVRLQELTDEYGRLLVRQAHA